MDASWTLALAASGANTLVALMMTDAWPAAKDRFARWFGRGEPAAETRAAGRLDRAAEELARADPHERDLVRARLRGAWEVRMQDLLDHHASAADGLRDLLAASGPLNGSAHQYNQRGSVHDHANATFIQGDNVSIGNPGAWPTGRFTNGQSDRTLG